jgi:hypothetical protein
VRLLARRRGKTAVPVPEVVSITNLPGNAGKQPQEVLIDIHLGKHDRTFVMRISPFRAGARENRFAGIEPDLRQIVTSKAGCPTVRGRRVR